MGQSFNKNLQENRGILDMQKIDYLVLARASLPKHSVISNPAKVALSCFKEQRSLLAGHTGSTSGFLTPPNRLASLPYNLFGFG